MKKICTKQKNTKKENIQKTDNLNVNINIRSLWTLKLDTPCGKELAPTPSTPPIFLWPFNKEDLSCNED